VPAEAVQPRVIHGLTGRTLRVIAHIVVARHAQHRARKRSMGRRCKRQVRLPVRPVQGGIAGMDQHIRTQPLQRGDNPVEVGAEQLGAGTQVGVGNLGQDKRHGALPTAQHAARP
jgi:hypothetical protein